MDPNQTAPLGTVCSGSTLFASILNSSVMLGNYLLQITSADNIFQMHFFLGALRVKFLSWIGVLFHHCKWNMSDLIWIQTVWHWYSIPERIFGKRWFWKKSADSKKSMKKKTACKELNAANYLFIQWIYSSLSDEFNQEGLDGGSGIHYSLKI